MTNLFKRNYKATVRRGLINDKTGHADFLHKIREETKELEKEVLTNKKDRNKIGFEMADIILVVSAYAQHYDLDIIDFIEKKVKYNEQRR